MKRLLIIDDHPLFRDALRNALEPNMAKVKVLEASSLDQGTEILKSGGKFSLILLDLVIPGSTGFDGLLFLRKQFPKIPVVVITGQEHYKLMREALNYGASGFILKSSSGEEIAKALEEVFMGNVYIPPEFENAEMVDDGTEALAARLSSLTRQQLAVLKMLREGKLNKQIAFELGVGETTIKAHVSEILRKLNVVSRTQAVIEAGRLDFDAVVNSGNGKVS